MWLISGPGVIKKSYSTQLSMKFQMPTGVKISSNSAFLGSESLECNFFLLIIVKLPIVAGILTLRAEKKFMLRIFYNLGAWATEL